MHDLDVSIEKAQHYLEAFPEDQRPDLAPLLEFWETKREKARARMLDYLDSADYFDFKRKFGLFLSKPGAGARPVRLNQPQVYKVCELAPVFIHSRLAAVRAYQDHLEDAPVELLHALRIEFKKLRYTVEYFREVLGESAGGVIEDLKTIQDHLGDLCDAHIAVGFLEKVIALEIDDAAPPEDRPSEPDDLPAELAGVAAYLEDRRQERQRLIEGFPALWERFSSPEFRQALSAALSAL